MSVVCCQVEVSATCRSLVQRSPTVCGVSESDLLTSKMRIPWPARAVQPQPNTIISVGTCANYWAVMIMAISLTRLQVPDK